MIPDHGSSDFIDRLLWSIFLAIPLCRSFWSLELMILCHVYVMIGIEDKLMNVEGHLREISLLRRLLWGRRPSFLPKVDVWCRTLRLHWSINVRMLQYTSRLYPSCILWIHHTLSTLKLRNCWELLGDLGVCLWVDSWVDVVVGFIGIPLIDLLRRFLPFQFHFPLENQRMLWRMFKRAPWAT